MIEIASQGGWHGLHDQTGFLVLAVVLTLAGIVSFTQRIGWEGGCAGILLLYIGISLLAFSIYLVVNHGF
jgi:hypothetical protein